MCIFLDRSKCEAQSCISIPVFALRDRYTRICICQLLLTCCKPVGMASFCSVLQHALSNFAFMSVCNLQHIQYRQEHTHVHTHTHTHTHTSNSRLCRYFFFFLLEQQPPMGQGLFIHEVFRSHTTTHHIRQDSSKPVISSSQRPLPDNTQPSQETDFHAPGGIRTHSLRRAAANLRLRPRGHCDCLCRYQYA